MSKLAQATSKYLIQAKFSASGVVEKPDVIGAVFGQTEGLLGTEMDLRELQRTGRIGRIDVDLKVESGKTTGSILIPSSLDASETSLIAATLETIERIGPCDAQIKVEKVEDVRASKRQYLVDRAKDILSNMFDEGAEVNEITEQIKEAVRSADITEYKGLPAGPDILSSEALIICEGRADVVRLLKNGIKNAIAVEGTSVPEVVVEISRGKETTAFLDGDRGGDLILMEMFNRGVNLDFVARAPDGKEVEELSKKEIYKALRERIPADQARDALAAASQTRVAGVTVGRRVVRTTEMRARPETREAPVKVPAEMVGRYKSVLEELTGTRAAYLFDREMNILGKIPVKEMFNAMREVKEAETLIFDGAIDQKLVNFASNMSIRHIVGMKTEGKIKAPKTMSVFTSKDLA